jgi:hypothetical protein
MGATAFSKEISIMPEFVPLQSTFVTFEVIEKLGPDPMVTNTELEVFIVVPSVTTRR